MKTLFEIIFERKPKELDKEEGEERRYKALEKALENSTPERPGTPWDYKDRPKKKDPEWW